jgi:hypothetical protein
MSFTVALQLGYQIALAALCGLTLLTGEWRMKRTALAIFGVMLAAWLLRGLWPGIGYAWAMIAVDSAALAVITWRPAGRWQAIVGLSYILQIATHIGRIAAAKNADMNSYWWGLSIIAILQLLLVGGWWLNERSIRHRLRGCADTASAYSRSKSVAR